MRRLWAICAATVTLALTGCVEGPDGHFHYNPPPDGFFTPHKLDFGRDRYAPPQQPPKPACASDGFLKASRVIGGHFAWQSPTGKMKSGEVVIDPQSNRQVKVVEQPNVPGAAVVVRDKCSPA